MADIGVKSVPDRLRAAADLFEERNRQYGSNYKNFGAVMAAMYPDGLTVKSADEWTRLILQVHRVTKETRYACNFGRGGHADSLEDMAVYAIMAAEIDEEVKQKPSIFPTTGTDLTGSFAPSFVRTHNFGVGLAPADPPETNCEWRRELPRTLTTGEDHT